MSDKFFSLHMSSSFHILLFLRQYQTNQLQKLFYYQTNVNDLLYFYNIKMYETKLIPNQINYRNSFIIKLMLILFNIFL